MSLICRSLLILLLPALLAAQTVRFRTNLGDIDVILLPQSAPRTVQNFLSYTNRGVYNNTIFHRSVPGFVIQGGGFRFTNNAFAAVSQDPPIRNEYNVSNTRGTIAMAKLGSGPDTATNQWFFNLGDNSQNLNNQNGGFTVFGRIANDAGLQVMDRIAALRVIALDAPFDALPVQNFSGTLTSSNLVTVTSISVLAENPTITDNGIQTASAFGGFPYAAPGSHVEIYGSRLGGGNGRAWASRDFNGPDAPISLDGVNVTVNGVRAYVSYASPSQVNVQLPTEIPTGTVSIVVNYQNLPSNAVRLPVRERAPGLLAPSSFKVGDKQYAVAARPAGGFAANGIPGVPNAPAIPGETLIFYGTGFGDVTPSSVAVAGRIADALARTVADVEIRVGDTRAEVGYAGLAPGLVGVYQFNVVVPKDAQAGDQRVRVFVAGEETEQTLYIPVVAQ
ncbi:MAG: peptidylprolyl isomerase [Bryobacteraceae bacterium]